jgi:cytochrome c556
MMKQKILFGLSLITASMLAFAHQQTGDDRVDYRQGAYRIMGWHMGLLGDAARGEKPFDLEHVRESVKHLQWAERLTATTYSPDTRNAANSKLKAKAWQDMEAFANRGRSLKTAIDALVARADAGDEPGIKEAIGEVGKACKACHDDFREKMAHH